jgi:hypothetical protein
MAPLLAESHAPSLMFSIGPSFPWKLISASNYGGYSAFCLCMLPAKSVPLYWHCHFVLHLAVGLRPGFTSLWFLLDHEFWLFLLGISLWTHRDSSFCFHPWHGLP